MSTSTVEITPREVALLIDHKVDQLVDVVRQMQAYPIKSKQEALPILARINELLQLIPDPSDKAPSEITF